MYSRALMVCIEEYPSVTEGGLATSLPGAIKAGLEFREWLVEKWKKEGRTSGETQILFCSEPKQPGAMGATRKEILKALQQLKKDGQNQTDELYVFISGHGFSFNQKPGSRVDVLLASDFETAALSADCCLNLDEIVSWLRAHLGPGNHAYFVDACRNTLDASEIQVGDQLTFNPNTSEEASTFVLQSSESGSTAAADATFASVVLDGLRGKGRSKVWVDTCVDAMFVRYDSLRMYVKAALEKKQLISSRVEGTVGESELVLARLSPVPLSQCSVAVTNAAASESGTLSLKRRNAAGFEVKDFHALPLAIDVVPDSYSVGINLKNGGVEPAEPQLVDLYDDRTVKFTKIDPGPPPGAPSAPTLEPLAASTTMSVDLVVPPGAHLNLKDLGSGSEFNFGASARANLEVGPYLASLTSKSGVVLRRQEVELGPKGEASVNIADWSGSAAHRDIASQFPRVEGGIDFSESLGITSDPDLNLWLALIGGGRILGSKGDYSKLSRLPMQDFSGERSGASPVYVLAGFDNSAVQLRVSVSSAGRPSSVVTAAPPAMPTIREAYFPVSPGAQVVTFELDGRSRYSVASFALENRSTLLTLSLDDEGGFVVSQFLLPIGHLQMFLPDEVSGRLVLRNQLDDLRFLAQASRAFRRRRNLARAFPLRTLDELLYFKWIDPIASLLAAYELLRRGKGEELSEMVSNMTRYFSELPDTAALKKLLGKRVARPRAAPLFLDGLLAFGHWSHWLPPAAGRLDFRSPWTAWHEGPSDES